MHGLFSIYCPLLSNRHHQSNGDCLKGKREISRSVLCNIVCKSCAHSAMHIHEQTMSMSIAIFSVAQIVKLLQSPRKRVL